MESIHAAERQRQTILRPGHTGLSADDYPHNSAFKSRNDRWTSEGYRIASRSEDNWQFESDYIDRLKKTTLKNEFQYPEPDLVAWLYRCRQFEDDDSYETLAEMFRAEFRLTEEEINKLFSDKAYDNVPEDEDHFFDKRKPSEELVAEIAKSMGHLDLPELMEIIIEKSGPQPINIDDLCQLTLKGRGQFILQGPPGTGKTYLARQVTAKILGADDTLIASPNKLNDFLAAHQVLSKTKLPANAPGGWDIVQFHPSYNYEDFVRGISSEIDDGNLFFRAKDRTVASLCLLAERCSKPVVLIVDEINRGDISKVLGELIFGLEYRNQKIRTPYSVDGSPMIAVPSNFYLIATMNTADRSIALIDYAIRRRFDFVDVAPSRDALAAFLIHVALADGTTERVLALFDAVNTLLTGQPDYMIGHAYFMARDTEEIARRFVFQVLPLLAEYRREGILGEHVRVKPDTWIRDAGIPFVHPQPFVLAEQVSKWLDPRLP